MKYKNIKINQIQCSYLNEIFQEWAVLNPHDIQRSKKYQQQTNNLV